MPFALELPFRDTSAPSGPPDTPRRLRAWLAGVGQSDPREAARRLADMLAAQNRLALSPQRRLRLLEMLRPALRPSLDALAARVQAQALPLPERTRELAQLNRELLRALIHGYEIVLAAAAPAERATALAAERALGARGELLLRHAEVQEPLPGSFWRGTHALYAFAEATGVARRRVPDREWADGYRRRQSPEGAFIRLLLLALAHPRGLRQGEAARIHRATQAWCRDAQLAAAASAPADAVERGSVFAVDLDAATAPAQWRHLAGEAGDRIRVLDLGRVVARVARLHQRTVARGRAAGSAPGDGQAIGATGLKRLLDNWNPRPLRRPEHAAERVPVEVTLGLEALQRRIENRGRRRSGKGRHSRESLRYTHLPGYVLQTIAEDDTPETETTAYPHARAAAERPSQPGRRDRADGAASSDWLLEEAGASGFRLRWQGEGRSGATVGELVGLHSGAQAGPGQARSGGPARWRLGIVRWLQFVDDERFEIGCDLLSARPAAATVRREPPDRHRRTRPRGPGVPALLLPGAEGSDEAAAVLVPAHQFEPHEILELDVRERTLRVQLTAMREHSTYFTLFELAPAPARGRTSGVPETPAAGRSAAG